MYGRMYRGGTHVWEYERVVERWTKKKYGTKKIDEPVSNQLNESQKNKELF